MQKWVMAGAMINNHPIIGRAISALGSQSKLAEASGISQSSISRMFLLQERVSAEDAVAIERATGGAVSRHDLRPDLWPARVEAAS